MTNLWFGSKSFLRAYPGKSRNNFSNFILTLPYFFYKYLKQTEKSPLGSSIFSKHRVNCFLRRHK
jgi:hypothetical protein